MWALYHVCGIRARWRSFAGAQDDKGKDAQDDKGKGALDDKGKSVLDDKGKGLRMIRERPQDNK
jgi:hypothetical protein